jgi:APA family basic amino acid/polyamine antiporter
LRYKPQYTWPGMVIVLLGLPAYWILQRSRRNEEPIEQME